MQELCHPELTTIISERKYFYRFKTRGSALQDMRQSLIFRNFKLINTQHFIYGLGRLFFISIIFNIKNIVKLYGQACQCTVTHTTVRFNPIHKKSLRRTDLLSSTERKLITDYKTWSLSLFSPDSEFFRLGNKFVSKIRMRNGNQCFCTLPCRHSLEISFTEFGNYKLNSGTCIRYNRT